MCSVVPSPEWQAKASAEPLQFFSTAVSGGTHFNPWELPGAFLSLGKTKDDIKHVQTTKAICKAADPSSS